MNGVHVRSLGKSFGGRKVLSCVTFSLDEGKALGVIGPNAVGKTTLLKILATILKPDEGDLILFGEDALRNPEKVRKEISYVPEFPSVMEELTVMENLKFFASLRRKKVKEDVLELLNLEPFLTVPVSKVSKGIKQRLSLAIALISEPRLLILDEATSGLDAESTEVILNTLLRLKEKGVTIVMASHLKEEVERVCDETYALYNGSREGKR